MAEGIGPGDAVYLPSFTFTATAEVVVLLGAEPVFVDVSAENFNIDAEDLESRIDGIGKTRRIRPRAVIAVDLFGLPADYAAINAIAERHGMAVVGDAAQSFGATRNGRRVGTLAPVTATSFFPAKPLGCFGDGGALLADSPERAEVFRSIRAHGKGTGKYDIVRPGLNARLDTLQAAVLLCKLEVFAEELTARAALADIYDEGLAGAAILPQRDPEALSAWAQYSVLVDGRDHIAEALKAEGIPTAVYYPSPMHLQPAYSRFGQGRGSLPVSEGLSAKILSLPMHAYMETETAARICGAFRRVVGG